MFSTNHTNKWLSIVGDPAGSGRSRVSAAVFPDPIDPPWVLNVLKGENIPSQKKNDVKINCKQWKLFSFTWLQNQGGVQKLLSDYMKRAIF